MFYALCSSFCLLIFTPNHAILLDGVPAFRLVASDARRLHGTAPANPLGDWFSAGITAAAEENIIL